jgi:ribosomal protein S1
MKAFISKLLGRFSGKPTHGSSSAGDTEGFGAQNLRSKFRRPIDFTAYEVNQDLQGLVTGFATFGLYIRLANGEAGVVFNDHISWPGEDISYQIDEVVAVRVLGFKKGRGLSLSIREVKADANHKNYAVLNAIGDTVSGRIKKVLDYGIFVTLAPGVDGLLHNSNNANYLDYSKSSIGLTIDVKIKARNDALLKITLESVDAA